MFALLKTELLNFSKSIDVQGVQRKRLGLQMRQILGKESVYGKIGEKKVMKSFYDNKGRQKKGEPWMDGRHHGGLEFNSDCGAGE